MPRHQQVVRQWKLLRRLELSPQGLNVTEEAGDDGTKQRALYRDLDALQQAGFPLYTDEIDGQRRWVLPEAFRRGRGVPLTPSEVLALRCARCALDAVEGAPLFEGLAELIDKPDGASRIRTTS